MWENFIFWVFPKSKGEQKIRQRKKNKKKKKNNPNQTLENSPRRPANYQLQNSSHLLFTNCCFLVLTIVPLKGNYKAPSQWRCTLECLFMPHIEAKRETLVIWRFCPNAQRHEIPPTKHRLRYVSVALASHLSWCLSSCFLNTSFVAVGMSALKSSISLSTENAHCFLSFKISSKYFPVSN